MENWMEDIEDLESWILQSMIKDEERDLDEHREDLHTYRDAIKAKTEKEIFKKYVDESKRPLQLHVGGITFTEEQKKFLNNQFIPFLIEQARKDERDTLIKFVTECDFNKGWYDKIPKLKKLVEQAQRKAVEDYKNETDTKNKRKTS